MKTGNKIISNLLHDLLVFHHHRQKSKGLSGACIFTPTCSNYFVKAVEIHGIYKGMKLGISRIMRCNKNNAGGYDPVPQTIKKGI